jgi:hypothetical protein
MVTTRAKLITRDAECKRWYGSNWATKEVSGVVLDVICERSKQRSCFIKAKWELGEGHTKVGLANIRSVKAKLPPLQLDVFCEVNAVTDPLLSTRTTTTTTTTRMTTTMMPLQVDTQIEARRDVATNRTPTNLPKNVPVATVHGVDWYVDVDQSMRDVNGKIPYRTWHQIDTVGNHICSGSDPTKLRSRLDYFLLMFPTKQLSLMVALTNLVLADRNKKTTTKGEIVKFFGVCILIT